jgi:CO dehydrogenase/acetyl-CoA synthase gamma subunit (corrinoid Fe-S protein)
MPDADLYLERIDLARYLSVEECTRCGASSCRDLVERLLERACAAEDLGLPGDRLRGLNAALGLAGALPAVPSLQHPRPVEPALVGLNGPRPGDPVLVTGNSLLTQEVLLAVVSTTSLPLHVAFTDTRGDTLDMAVILASFTPERVSRSLEALAPPASSPLVLPGLAADLAGAISSATGRAVEVGPVCAAELPLYFGGRWGA